MPERFPTFESVPPAKPARAGHRALRAVAMAGALTLHTASSEAEKRHSSAEISLNAHEDHGLEKEIAAAERFGLKNFKNEADVRRALKEGSLVALKPSAADGYQIDATLGENAPPEHRSLYASLLPFAAEQLKGFAEEFYRTFHRKLIVSSALRTETYQDELRKTNTNAAHGYTSSHLKGTTVDVMYEARETAKRAEEFHMTHAEQTWMTDRLLTLEERELVQATREKSQPVFHIMFLPPHEKQK